MTNEGDIIERIGTEAHLLLRHIESLGYAVTIKDRGHSFTAIHRDSGQRHEVNGDDPYLTACKLAEAVGIDLRDG